ncbi:hypothetical protein MKEN_00950700 [Mycena kentingensis (nom. inval.)]|nr:hypothetical protein MKEN_00950700 [Mycena kentingensis (nom. inval.)]
MSSNPTRLQRMLSIAHAPLDSDALACIEGNASAAVKSFAVGWLNAYHDPAPRCFAGASTSRTVVKRVEVEREREGTGKVLTLVSEVEATEELLDRRDAVAQAFIIAILDECLSAAVTALDFHEGGLGITTATLGLDTAFHNPVPLGSTLRFICTTTAASTDPGLQSGRCEVWDVSLRRLVATAVLSGMRSSLPKPKL